MSSLTDSVPGLPEGWSVVRLGVIGRFSASGIDKKSIEDEQPVRMVNYTDVYGSKARAIDGSSDLMTVTCSQEKLAEHSLRRGDLLFTPSSETKAEIGFSAVVTRDLPDTVYSYHLVRFRPRADVRLDVEFQKYLCNHPGFLYQLQAASKGTTRQILTRDDFRSARVVLPPLDDQTAIASFLNRETARIDTLIEKKRRLLSLLDEKRTALITRSVTRGLDPDVPMKDSEMQWLARIPAHWTGTPLKRLLATPITDGPHETPPLVSEGVPFVSAEAISDGRIDFSKRRGDISEELHEQYRRKVLPRRGDILLCKSGATTGKLALVETDRTFSIWSPLALIRARSDRAIPQFLAYSLQSDYVQQQIRRTWSQGTQPNISMGNLAELFIAAPSVAEQEQILARVGPRLERINAIRGSVQRAITLLQEYRAATISASVTAKIDIRDKVLT